MKTLYLECSMGAAGDMLMSALCELLPQPEAFIERMNALGIPEVRLEAEKTKKCGISGTHIHVYVNGEEENEHMHEREHHDHAHDHDHEYHDHAHDHDHTHEHHHSSMHSIEHIISGLPVSDTVRENALAVYRLIAEAEAHAHDTDISQIHFHEVGTMDAVADVVGVCLLMEEIAPDKVICSPVNVGGGTVRCAHGILPVPAPATAHILRGVPIYSGRIKSELTTPTGAALLKHFASEFRDMPQMSVNAVGYGMGTKDFDEANCVRAMLGDAGDGTDEVIELRFNVDDMTGEQVGFALERLMDGGALDVFTAPVSMKKSRPGILFNILCREGDKDKILALAFKHTTTIGIREYPVRRHVMDRHEASVKTAHGEVRAKKSSGFGTTRVKAEYEDLADIAREKNISLFEV